MFETRKNHVECDMSMNYTRDSFTSHGDETTTIIFIPSIRSMMNDLEKPLKLDCETKPTSAFYFFQQ